MRKYTLVVLSCFLITSAFGDVIENKLDFQKLFQSKDVLSSQIIIYNHYSGIQGVDDKIQFSENLLQEAIRLDANEFMDLAHFFLGQSLIVKKDWDKASFNYHQILKRSQKKLIGLTGLVNFFNKRNQLDSLNHYLNEAEREYEKSDNEFLKSIYLRRLGLYKIEKEKYLEALDNLTIVSETPVIKDSAIGTICLFNIGYMYEHLNYPEQARIYYKKALINSRNNNTPNLSHFIKFKLSHINLFNFDNVDEALKGYKELEPIYTSSNKVHEGILYGTMGFAYLQKGNEDDAFKYMIKSRDYFERRKDSTFLCLPYTYLTHYYVAKQQYDKAIENGERAKKIIEDKNLFDARKLILLDKIAEAYFAIGKYDKSNGLLNELNNIKTKLEIKKNTVAFTDNQYEKRISEEKLNIANLKYQISEKNKLLYIFLLSALGIILLFTSILYHNRKKTTDKLKELDTAKSKFFANISHEFRTPLTLINNPIEEALADETLPEKKREQFDVAKRNSDRLLSLVNQLLDLSKIDAGQLKLRIQQGKINQLIAALADSFAYSAKQKDIEFNVALDHKESVDYFDKDAVEKIVVNLLSNAIKYTPEKGSISCNSTVKNGRLELEVKNTGVGLTEEEQQSLFQRFYQTNENNVGTGIGLALVKELVDMHKGDIKVHSVPDQWTSFSVTIPVDRNSYKNDMFVEANDNETTVIPIVTQQVTHEDREDFIENDQPILLVVEDNADVRTLLKQTFEEQYNILSAENGQEGINLALEHVPDIIISDIMMPVKDGIALTKELKQNQLTSHVPIVLLTAKAGEDNELQGIETGADDYMTKPFSTKILMTKVAKLVELRQKLHDRYSQELILKPKDLAVNNIDEQFLERIQDVLEDKLVESSFKIEEFSKALGMSRMQLHRKIKALTGLSASEFIRSQRLKLAAQLLKESDINISQVGYSVGFNDSSYFAKCFKQTYNCTPTEYAKKQA